MILLYLSKANLSDKVLMHELAHYFDKASPALIIHEAFGEKVEDTFFVTKRLSSILGEALIVNVPHSGERMGLFSRRENKIIVDAEIILKLRKNANVIITNTLIQGDEKTEHVAPEEVLTALIQTHNFSGHYVFPANSRSPLGMENVQLENPMDYDRLLSLFDEEKAMLDIALKLCPAIISRPANLFLR